MQFWPPKGLGRRFPHSESSRHWPSTTNRYSCAPGSSATVVFQVPSFWRLSGIGFSFQSVKSPTNNTLLALGSTTSNVSFFAGAVPTVRCLSRAKPVSAAPSTDSSPRFDRSSANPPVVDPMSLSGKITHPSRVGGRIQSFPDRISLPPLRFSLSSPERQRRRLLRRQCVTRFLSTWRGSNRNTFGLRESTEASTQWTSGFPNVSTRVKFSRRRWLLCPTKG